MQVLARQIQIARKQRRWSEAELAERAGTTRPTIREIEKGNASTSLGLYFEVATLLGIPLFAESEQGLDTLQERLGRETALLPKRIDRQTSDVFDDF